MNQILFNENSNHEQIEITSNQSLSNNKFKKIFQIQLILSSIIIFLCILHICFKVYINNKNEITSRKIKDSFNITTLYSNNTVFSTSTVKQSNITSDKIIGIIEIPDININYPFFFDTTDELLKVSPCRFYGPLPNNVGNLCIAGHNYNNNKFFSKLNLLDFNSRIRIYDLSRNICRLFRI